MTRKLEIPTARVFLPLLNEARYKGAHGGRGSGKSHFFAGLVIDDSLAEPGLSGEGLRTVCIREVQKDLKESAKLLIEDKLNEFKLGEADGFKVFRDVIQTPKDGLIIFKGMQDYTAESIKSLERFKRAWIEEAQTLSTRSLTLLRPTIRSPGSQIWASWNPRRKQDAIDEFLRQKKPEQSIVVSANWRDNPWFPVELEHERKLDAKFYPDRYDHIWEGGYVTVFEGAYYSASLAEAKRKGRIGNVAVDPILPLKAFVDIGGAGAKADAFAMWIVQFVGQNINVLDYYEAVGQPLSEHIAWLRSRKYLPTIYLPHDGVNANAITGKRYQDHISDAGFDVVTISNQGAGAASLRIEAARRIFPRCWFNASTTEPGRDALGYYHERKDESRQIGLGPEHDWSSHCCDAWGLMAVCYEGPDGPMNVDELFGYDRSHADSTRSSITGY